MPATSKSQFRFFQYLAHNPKAAKSHGMSTAKAKEYVSGQSPKDLPQRAPKK